jgi:hypothetical protein
MIKGTCIRRNAIVYVYAETTSGPRIVWHGPLKKVMKDGRELGFMQVNVGSRELSYEITITCPGF